MIIIDYTRNLSQEQKWKIKFAKRYLNPVNLARVFILSRRLFFTRLIIVGRGVRLLGKRKFFVENWVEISDYTRIQCSDHIHIEKMSFIGPRNIIYGTVRIHKFFMSGPNVAIIAGNHGTEAENIPFIFQRSKSKKILVASNVWIGTGSVVLDDIGPNTVLGATSLVSRPLKGNGIFVGSPVRKIKDL